MMDLRYLRQKKRINMIEVFEAEKKNQYDFRDILYLLQQPIYNDSHFIANGYANSWYIEPTENTTYVLYYLPQSFYYLGFLISIFTIFFIPVLFFVKKNKISNVKNVKSSFNSHSLKSIHQTPSLKLKNNNTAAKFNLGKSLRILQVPPGIFQIPPKKGGGIEKVISSLSIQLSKNGHKVHVIANRGGNNPDYDKITYHSIPYFGFSFGAGFYTWIKNFLVGNFFIIIRLLSLIPSLSKFDVIHCHDSITCLFIIFIRPIFFRKIPVVFTVHSTVLNPTLIKYSGIKRYIMRITIFLITRAIRKVDFDIVFTKARYNELISVCKANPRRIAIVQHPIDVSGFANHQYNANYLREKYDLPENFCIYVGRLSKAKGLDVLLRALSKTNLNCVIVGYGSEYYNLKKLASDLNISKRVKFTGLISDSDIKGLYKMADFFVFSSYSEGFPQVIAEAMSCRLPVVSTNASGISEIVLDGYNGYTVEIGNVDDLIDKILMISSDRSKLEIMKDNSFKTAKTRFDLDVVVKATQGVYVNAAELKGN